MANNFPAYPATTLEQGTDLVIYAGNQIGNVVNGDATTEVETENGMIPSLRKALVDNFYFKDPIDWQVEQTETVFNQLRFFSNGVLSAYYYAPTATTSNPVVMGNTPSGDANWVLYAVQQTQIPSEVYPWLLEVATGEELTISPPYVFDSAIVTINGVVQVPENSYTIQNSKIILKEPLGVDPRTGQANILFAYLGKVEAGASDYIQTTTLASNIGASFIGEVGSVTSLRNLLPIKTNQKVVVKGYAANSTIGGGTFYYQADTTTVDDSGTFLRVSTSGGWKRQIQDDSALNITHFGATPGGVVDCSAAFLAMHTWSQRAANGIGVQFPAGKFKLSGVDLSGTYISKFRMSGPATKFGYDPVTTLVSDRGTGFMVRVQARNTQITNFIIDGERNTQANTKGFFQNTCVAGQRIRSSSMTWNNMGGWCLSLLDTLDTKIDQFYMNNCNGGGFYATWSNTSAGSWDHITAIELTNFNVQNCSTMPVFDLQRAGQSLISNGWIEKTEFPGNLSNGQWIIDAFSMEDCTNPMYCAYSRMQWRQNNLQGTSKWDKTSGADSRWLSPWEMGTIDIENHGTEMTGSLTYGYLTQKEKLDNNTGDSQWYHAGYFYIPTIGDVITVKVEANRGYTAVANDPTVNGLRYGGGEGIIRLQRKADNYVDVTWEGHGACPIEDVKFNALYATDCNLYIKLGSYTRNAMLFVSTNSKTRFEAGQCFRFDRKGTPMTADEVNDVNGIQTALPQASWNAGTSGIAIAGDGYLSFKGPATSNNQWVVYINGVKRIITFTDSPTT